MTVLPHHPLPPIPLGLLDPPACLFDLSLGLMTTEEVLQSGDTPSSFYPRDPSAYLEAIEATPPPLRQVRRFPLSCFD